VGVENISDTAEREEHPSLVKSRQKSRASAFRNRITTGRSFKVSNSYREEFYNDIIELTDKVTFPS
jgi:hypothetical protein